MKNKQKYIFLLAVALVLLGFTNCSIKYNFSMGSVDYTVYQSISIADFPNNAELVNPTLSQTFTEELRDKFTRQTRLTVLKSDGDMQIEGEIIGYELQAMSISADSYASETKLTLTINVRFVDTKDPQNDFDDKRYSSFQLFDSDRMLADVEDEIVTILIKEIIDNIYNDTVAKW